MKQIGKIYAETFLGRLLRLVELFSNVASISEQPLSMVQRVANPFHLTCLLNLLLISSPRSKITVLKIIQNLIRVEIPSEVFEETTSICKQNQSEKTSSFFEEMDAQRVKFNDTDFINFLFSYLMQIKSTMWSNDKIESQGQYEVAQEIYNVFQLIQEVGSDEKYAHWK